MKAKIIKVGNSKGIRIPSGFLKQCNINEEVEIYVEENKIVLEPVKKARSNWPEAFKEMNKRKDDQLLINDNLDLNLEGWEW